MSTPELSRDQILEKVAQAIATQKQCPVESITLESKFEDLGVDSLDAAEILFELEDSLDVDIPDGPARSMRAVHQVVDGLEKLVAGEEIPYEEPPAPTPSVATGGAASEDVDRADDVEPTKPESEA
jgi:acyl carrier protein